MSNRENRQDIVTIDGINYNIMIPENGIERLFLLPTLIMQEDY